MQSSLAAVLSLTSGFSPCPCVSIFGTGPCGFRARISLRPACLACPGYSVTRYSLTSPSLRLTAWGTGISASLPSATPLGLALGPDSPREDEPSPGDLGPSVCRIPTCISLLTPAFSLPSAPHALPVMLLCWMERSPTITSVIHSFGVMLSPGKLSARSHSTSELLRTLQRMAASEPTS